jgi:hypothetical protein
MKKSGVMRMKKSDPLSERTGYKIRIQGELDEQWLSWFNGGTILLGKDREGGQSTTLLVSVPDQAKLRGILNQIWDLNLTVISIIRIEGI